MGGSRLFARSWRGRMDGQGGRGGGMNRRRRRKEKQRGVEEGEEYWPCPDCPEAWGCGNWTWPLWGWARWKGWRPSRRGAAAAKWDAAWTARHGAHAGCSQCRAPRWGTAGTRSPGVEPPDSQSPRWWRRPRQWSACRTRSPLAKCQGSPHRAWRQWARGRWWSGCPGLTDPESGARVSSPGLPWGWLPSGEGLPWAPWCRRPGAGRWRAVLTTGRTAGRAACWRQPGEGTGPGSHRNEGPHARPAASRWRGSWSETGGGPSLAQRHRQPAWTPPEASRWWWLGKPDGLESLPVWLVWDRCSAQHWLVCDTSFAANHRLQPMPLLPKPFCVSSCSCS